MKKLLALKGILVKKATTFVEKTEKGIAKLEAKVSDLHQELTRAKALLQILGDKK